MRQKRAVGGWLVECSQDGPKMVFDMVGIVTITRGVVLIWRMRATMTDADTIENICANAERGSRRTVFVQSAGMKML